MNIDHFDHSKIIASAWSLAGGTVAMITTVSTSSLTEVAIYSSVSVVVGLVIKTVFDFAKSKLFPPKEPKL